MRYLFFVAAVVLTACQTSLPLDKRTTASGAEPYVVSIVDPMGPADFYHRLCDSLDQHMRQINQTGLGRTVKETAQRDEFYGWLQDQFDDEASGLGKKASSLNKADRTSEEQRVNLPDRYSNDKFSFTAEFKLESIPVAYLYPDKWKAAVEAGDHAAAIEAERARFGKEGALIRSKGTIRDTLYVYEYTIPVGITLNYYQQKENKWKTSSFTLPTVAAVYHQLKFQ